MRSPTRKCLALLLFLSSAALLFAFRPDQDRTRLTDSRLLGGDQRMVAYVSTDKPIYRAGEQVFIRTVVLDAFDRTPHKYTPVPNGRRPQSYLSIRDPKGAIAARGIVSSNRLAGCGSRSMIWRSVSV